MKENVVLTSFNDWALYRDTAVLGVPLPFSGVNIFLPILKVENFSQLT